MTLSHEKPNESLRQELEVVADHAEALSKALASANALPIDFPKEQLEKIASVLKVLPLGTAEGCRVPLEYARARLPAIRAEHIEIEESDKAPGQASPETDDYLPPPTI